MKNITIFVPYSIECIFLQNVSDNSRFVIFYNSYIFMSLNLSKVSSDFSFDKNTNTLQLLNLTLNDKTRLFNDELNKFIFSWDSFYFNKIKFTGKGFKFKKKDCNLFLFFNRAHKCFFIGNNIVLLRLSKNRVIILKNNFKHLMHDSKLIRNVRCLNVFTKRGLRFSRQIVLKKKGKTASN